MYCYSRKFIPMNGLLRLIFTSSDFPYKMSYDH